MRVALVSGSFNVLHPGHLRLLRFAKSICDTLCVEVYSDQKAGAAAYVSENERLEAVKCLDWLDVVFLGAGSITEIVDQWKVSIVVKGFEHRNMVSSEEEILISRGVQFVYAPADVIYSGRELLQRTESKRILSTEVFTGIEQFLRRHSLVRNSMINVINEFKELNVCVFGDLIIDNYINCEPLGMSQEDPTIVVQPINERSYIGGAGVVAAHANALGANVSFFSVIGQDTYGLKAVNELSEVGIKVKATVDEFRPTTSKTRYRSKGKTLLRVNNLSSKPISKEIEAEILRAFQFELDSKRIDLVIFSDFSYGFLTDRLINELIRLCRNFNIVYSADSQSSSQFGDIMKFKNADILFATEREARLGTKENSAGLVELGSNVINGTMARNLFLKLGEHGVIIHCADNSNFKTDQIAALNSNPKDVSGAGDSMLVSASLAFVRTKDIWIAGVLGSLAAAIQVSREGNIPISSIELKELFEL